MKAPVVLLLSTCILCTATKAEELLCVEKSESRSADRHYLIAKVIRHYSAQIPQTITVHEQTQTHNDSVSRDYLMTSQVVVDPKSWHWVERNQGQLMQLCVRDPSISYKTVKKHD